MDIRKLTTFFMWCTIINGALLVLAITGFMVGSDLWYSMQSKMFHITQENLTVAIYNFLGFFKIAWLVFNAVPYVALLIVEKK